MKHCNIFANRSQYDASIGDIRTACKNNNDFDTWDAMLPCVSIIDGGVGLKYTPYELTVAWEGGDPYEPGYEFKEFLCEGEPYYTYINITVPLYYTFAPYLTIKMNGADVSDKYGTSQPLPGRPEGSRDWQYIIDIPVVTGDIRYSYGMPWFK